MRILYIGCVESSYVFLKSLIDNNFDVVGVITKQESAFNSDFMDITPLCRDNGIPFCYVTNINEEMSVAFIKERKADVGFCFGWSQLIEGKVIDLFPQGIIGYHPAALPHNRGRHPIIWALALGLEKTASTFFKIDKEADTGDILSQLDIEIEYGDNAATLMRKLLDAGKLQVVEVAKGLETGELENYPQDMSAGNSWRKRGKMDGQIDWRMSSRSIYNLVRALTKPYVGAHFIKGDKEIKVWSVREIMDASGSYANIEPGKVIKTTEKTFIVKCGENLVEVLDYEPVKIKNGDYL